MKITKGAKKKVHFIEEFVPSGNEVEVLGHMPSCIQAAIRKVLEKDSEFRIVKDYSDGYAATIVVGGNKKIIASNE